MHVAMAVPGDAAASRTITTAIDAKEMAVLLDSPALDADLAARMRRDRAPDRSWQVMMRVRSRELCWQGERDGQPVRVRHEPDASAWLRAWSRIARHIPHIERLL